MPDDLATQILRTWNTHNRINLDLLAAIPDEALNVSLKPKGRTVVDLFAHMHQVRLMWLKPAAPELLKGLDKVPAEPKRKDLVSALTASGGAVARLLEQSTTTNNQIKSFKGGVVTFLAYLISHESHHRGQIGWTLKLTDHALPKDAAYAMWDWSPSGS